jgi:hypothetical protein
MDQEPESVYPGKGLKPALLCDVNPWECTGGLPGRDTPTPINLRMASISPVSALSSSSYDTATSILPSSTQIQSDLQSLSSALQAGNLTNAQQAFATLQKDAPGLVQASGNPTSSPISSALSAVGTALSKDNISGAQQAFATLQQAGKGHHHRHHGGVSLSNATSSAASTSSSSSSVSSLHLNVTA